MRVTPRKARPFVPETKVVLDSPRPTAMTTADPISLAQAQRLAANADTILLRPPHPADLETPIGAFLRLDDGNPAYLLESVEGGERLRRYSFLGGGPRPLLRGRGGRARVPPPAPPRGARRHRADPAPARDGPRLPPGPADRDERRRRPAGRHPRVRATPSRPADRGHAPLHRRGRRGARL